MSIKPTIDHLKQNPPRRLSDAQSVLALLTPEDQSRLIAGVYIGRDHIHASHPIPGNDFSRRLTDHIDPAEYAQILYEKSSNMNTYLTSLERCATAGGIDIDKI